tara:strand:+ start:811 stop:1659 length:849 start_codon:yes stop_codon:yes gene_type:complete
MLNKKKFRKIKSFAKINLSLNVIGRLKNKYHKIESIVTFVNLHDEILIRYSNKMNHMITFDGNFSKGIQKNNTIKKLLRILDSKNYLNNKKFEIKVIKNIPHSSGLGGGSMNAAFLMQFLLKKNMKKDFNLIAKKIGSDVQLGGEKKNLILYKNGKVFKTNKKILLHVVICKPNFGCSTKFIYSRLRKFSKSEYNLRNYDYLNIRKLPNYKNDLESVAFQSYKKLRNLKIFFDSLPNLLFSRMTGSGSAIVGYFKSSKDAKKANMLIKKQYKTYWSVISKTI